MSNKGITPVIATVLLMTITVAATASAFTFMTEIQDSFKENTEDRLNEQQRESQSDLDIETAYNSTDGYIMLNIRNTGSLTLEVEDDQDNKLWNLFTNGSPVGDGTGWSNSDDVSSLAPQSTIRINTTESFPAKGSDTLIRITGPNGVSDSKVCYNSGTPSC